METSTARRPSWPVAAGLVLLTLSACAPEKPVTDPASLQRAELAARVTIYRDAWGVPHVHGETDAAAAFGLAYAQAEDNFPQIEENFVRAIGRASEVHGEETLRDDWVNRSLRVEALARREYEGADERLRALLDGYAAGLEHYVESHPEARSEGGPHVLERFEPWYPLALIRYLYYQRGFLRAAGLAPEEIEAEMAGFAEGGSRAQPADRSAALGTAPSGSPEFPRSERGSNSWAVTAERSANGHPLLLINPHLPFFGPSQVYEGHVSSDEGWNMSGYTRLGFPLPYVGFNEHLAWASTDNAADLVDLYAETFDDAGDATRYRYGDGHRPAVVWTDEILVAGEGGAPGPDTRRFTFRATHHGPVVARRGGRPLAVRMAKLEEPGWLDQWYAMTRATNLSEFRDAVGRLDMLFGNYLYADREGHIFYAYNAAVPRRSEGFDWSAPVDGSDPATEWQGYHPMVEIPQVLDPPTGWLQNCNGTPFLATAEGSGANPDPAAFPTYMVPEPDNARSRNARRILSAEETLSLDRWIELSYATFSITAEEEIPGLVGTWERLRGADPERAAAVAEPVAILREWDRVSTVDSEATTLFVTWFETRWRRGNAEEGGVDPWLDIRALEETMADLEERWGSWRVAWGEVNRLQRVASNGEGFDDDAPSFASAGVPSWAGAVFTMWSGEVEGERRRYGVGGNSYVAVVELGPKVEARSLLVFGASADPESKHHLDQAERYLTGDYKPAWLALEDVQANAVRSYRPGEERGRE